MKSRFHRMAAVLVVAGVVAACGSGDDDDAGGTTASSGAAVAPTPTGSAGSTPVGTGGTAGGEWVTDGVDRDATIKIGTYGPMTGADPQILGATINTPYFNLMYDRLFWVGPNSVLEPYLVTDWEFVDGALVLTLRDDATFQDGSPIDATAVKANIERAQTLENSQYVNQLKPIESIDVVDPVTVQLNLAPSSGATLPYVLGGWAGMMINPKFFDPEALKTTAPDGVGSGPYKVVEWTPEMVAFERVDGHWDEVAGQAARIEMYSIPDPTQLVNTVTAGQIDMAMTGSLPALEAVKQAEDNPDELQVGGLIPNYATSSNFFMRDNVDPIVRKAISLATDRDALDALSQGTSLRSNQMWPEGHPMHMDEIDDLVVFDPEQAKELLETAPDGSTSFSMGYIADGVPAQVAELFQAQMAAVGIEVELVPMNHSSLYQAWFDDQFEVASMGTAGPSHASTGISSILLRGGTSWGAPDSALPEIEAALAEADDPALGDDERNEIYRQQFLRAEQEHWVVVHGTNLYTSYASADLVNVGPELPFQYQSLPDFRYVAKKAQ